MNLTSMINLLFYIYEVLITVRIFASWFPQLQAEPLIEQIAQFTDPYLKLFSESITPSFGCFGPEPSDCFIRDALGSQQTHVFDPCKRALDFPPK